jgi:hypothetical protein
MNCCMCDRDRHESVLVRTPVNRVYKDIDIELNDSKIRENDFICMECLAIEFKDAQASDIES